MIKHFCDACKSEIKGGGEQWSTSPPTEAGWYKTRGRLRMCVEAVEIAGDVWPDKTKGIDWEDFKGCEFSRIIWEGC